MPPARDIRAALRALPCGARLLDAAAGGDDAWLVGGAVRDLMLDREPRELDVAVEGAVGALAGRLGDPLRNHERFGTATVLDHGCRYDLAATRAETYAEPGALPDVAPAGIDEDLVRRDFTVNALAMRLRDGELRGVPHALEDLEAGVLRVLHDASFTDDPTRLWRLARYAARLGFAVDERTRALAGRADPATVSGTRHGNELRLVLAEPDPGAALEALAGLNALVLPDGFVARPPGLDDGARAAARRRGPAGPADARGLRARDRPAAAAGLARRPRLPRRGARPRRRRVAREHLGAAARRGDRRGDRARGARARRSRRWRWRAGRTRARGSGSCATSGWRSPATTSSRPACPRAPSSGSGCAGSWTASSTGSSRGASRSSRAALE